MERHAVVVSSPGLGHLIPAIELGRRFALLHNLKVTVIAVTCQTSPAEAHLLESPNLIHDHVIDVMEIPSPPDPDAATVTRLCVMMRRAKPAIRSALTNMSLRPSLFVVDIFGTEALSIAKEFNILSYVFVASHAWFLSLLLHSPLLDQQVQGQYVDQKHPLPIPGCNPVRPQDVVDPMLDRNDMQYQEYLGIGNGIPKSDGVLVNTWEELQPKVLGALRDADLLGGILKVPVYGIGPVVRQHATAAEPEPEPEHEGLVQWLHQQPTESVVYVSFGSGGSMSREQLTELAWGLELSEQRFVWVVRPPSVGGADAAFFSTGHGEGALSSYLPEGFVSRTHRDRVGLLLSEWAPQVTILSHPSVGGFLSHCGWNSVLESITNGVPMVAWPLYAEQRMNATLLAEELGVAVRPKALPADKVVGRQEIASMVREIMAADQSNPARKRVKDMQHSAAKALLNGGSSFAALSQVVKTIV